jgi:tetratricopeptide (TPR) repeat protein
MNGWCGLAAAAILVGTAGLGSAQDRRPDLDVEHYVVNVDINPRTQALAAEVEVRFIPLEDVTSAIFELNNGMNVTRVAGPGNSPVSAVRYQQDFTVRLGFAEPLKKGQPASVMFTYDGRLAGLQDSPVEGINFGQIYADRAFLLYPARWFPVNNYSADRFTAELNVTVPTGMRVLASGFETTKAGPEGRTVYSFRYEKPSFPGSLAVVSAEPDQVSSSGSNVTLYFRDEQKAQASAYGEAVGQMVQYFSSVFGLPPTANLTVIQTEEHAPNGYAAPGLLFLSPRGIGDRVNTRLLAQQVAHQWWRVLVSPISRRHLWLDNGFANYSRMLYLEQMSGPSALTTEVQETMVEALTTDETTLLQADALPDYSPELSALVSSKGAVVLHMLRNVIGDDAFFAGMKEFAHKFAWQPATSADFERVISAAAKQDLQYFFIQWVESGGASEFKMTYTIYRLGEGKGFRVLGKVMQDRDTFRMPVELLIETEGEPERKLIEVAGTASEFSVETFGRPRRVVLDPDRKVLRIDDSIRVSVAIRKGEQLAELGYFNEALQEYQKALDVNRNSSLAHYRIAEVFFLQGNYQSAANEFREALNGDQDPQWTEVWAHINLGKIFDITGQRERAVNEYQQAIRTKDNTQGALDEANKYLQAPYQRPRRSGEP